MAAASVARPPAFAWAVLGHQALHAVAVDATSVSGALATLAVGVACAAPLAARRLPAAIGGLPIALAAALLVPDGLHRRVFAAPLALAGLDESQHTRPALWLSSIASEADLRFGLGVAGWLLFVAGLATARTGPPPRWAWAGLLGLLVGRDHPLLALRSGAAPAREAPGEVTVPLVWGEPAHDAAAAAAARARLGDHAPRNVVLVVLESVGSLQLLRDGAPDPEVAPFLASVAAEGLVADQVYGHYPATVRSHLALHTGGVAMTLGSVLTDLAAPYQGPTLPGALRDGGLRGAAFSAMYLDDGENLIQLYDQLGFERVAEPGREGWSASKLSSWGVDERAVADAALDWVPSGPFFLVFLTVSTHHPYVADPPAEGDRAARHRAALRFTDGAIARLWAGLAARGLAEDTLLAVVGDHGESFGDRHAGNLGHKDHLYEENLRNFLLLHRPGLPPARLHGVYGLGDVAPTVLDAAGLPIPEGFVGRSLLAPDYAERVRFFQKNAQPEAWGLRDGRWKYVAGVVPGAPARLFDLAADPLEAADLAAERPEQVARYRDLVAGWYFGMEQLFRSREPAGGARWYDGVDREALVRPGVAHVRCGLHDGRTLTPRERFTRIERPSCRAEVRRPEGAEGVGLRFTWVSPAGRPRTVAVTTGPSDTAWRMPSPQWPPLEPGEWTVAVADDLGNEVTTTFVAEP